MLYFASVPGCGIQQNKKSWVFQEATYQQVWWSGDKRQPVWQSHISFRSSHLKWLWHTARGLDFDTLHMRHSYFLLTMNMARKLLRSVNNSSTEVFFGSMAKYSSKFWYSVSMLVCRTTNLPHCSRAIWLKLWGPVVKVSNNHRALSNVFVTVFVFDGEDMQYSSVGNK